MKSGDICEVADVVRNLTFRQKAKGLATQAGGIGSLLFGTQWDLTLKYAYCDRDIADIVWKRKKDLDDGNKISIDRYPYAKSVCDSRDKAIKDFSEKLFPERKSWNDEKREIMDRLKKRATELSEKKNIVFGGVLVDAVENKRRELKSDGFNSDPEELMKDEIANREASNAQKIVAAKYGRKSR